MNISLAELLYVLAGSFILVATFSSWYLIDSPDNFPAFFAVFIAIMFWTLSFRAYSLAMQGLFLQLAESKEKSSKLNWRLPLGVSLKGIAVVILIICLSKWGRGSVQWFMLATIFHLFLGAFFLVLAGPKNNKSK